MRQEDKIACRSRSLTSARIPRSKISVGVSSRSVPKNPDVFAFARGTCHRRRICCTSASTLGDEAYKIGEAFHPRHGGRRSRYRMGTR